MAFFLSTKGCYTKGRFPQALTITVSMVVLFIQQTRLIVIRFKMCTVRMDSRGLVRLVYETLNNWYRNQIEDWKTHISSPSVWLDLVCLYKEDLVLIGYDPDEFTYELMDSELEKRVVFSNCYSPIGMDWEKDEDGFEGFHYWIED